MLSQTIRRQFLGFVSIFCSFLFLLSACQFGGTQENPSTHLPEREDLLRLIHRAASDLRSSETQYTETLNIQNRFIQKQNHLNGSGRFSYDHAHSLTQAEIQEKSLDEQEHLIWFPSRAYLSRNGSDWENSSEYPNQSYSLLRAYHVFSKLEDKFQMLMVKDHPDLVEFYFDTSVQSGLQILSHLGDLNLQKLPLHGIRGLAHFYVHKETGDLQQVDVSVEAEENQQELYRLQMLFYKINESFRLEAPAPGQNKSSDEQKDSDSALPEGTRWVFLTRSLQALQKQSSYHYLSDLQYIYNIQGQHLQGHIVDQTQMIHPKNESYFVRGDRRIENDKIDQEKELYFDPSGTYTKQGTQWIRENDSNERDPASTLINDLMGLNQELSGQNTRGQIIYSYSGDNPLFFPICQHLFHLDLSQIRQQRIQIDLSLTVQEDSYLPEKFQIHLKSPYNDRLDLKAKLEFWKYNAPVLVEKAILSESQAVETSETAVPAMDGPGEAAPDFVPQPLSSEDWAKAKEKERAQTSSPTNTPNADISSRPNSDEQDLP